MNVTATIDFKNNDDLTLQARFFKITLEELFDFSPEDNLKQVNLHLNKKVNSQINFKLLFFVVVIIRLFYYILSFIDILLSLE